MTDDIRLNLNLSIDQYAERLHRQMQDVYKTIQTNRNTQVDRARIRCERLHRAAANYNVGDHVWLLNEANQKGQPKAYKRQWKGPYRILDRTGPSTYVIECVTPHGRKTSKVVNAERLKTGSPRKSMTVQIARTVSTQTNELATPQPPHTDRQIKQSSSPTVIITATNDDPPAATSANQPMTTFADEQTPETNTTPKSSTQTTTTTDQQALTQSHVSTEPNDYHKSRQVGKYTLRNKLTDAQLKAVNQARMVRFDNPPQQQFRL